MQLYNTGRRTVAVSVERGKITRLCGGWVVVEGSGVGWEVVEFFLFFDYSFSGQVGWLTGDEDEVGAVNHKGI